VVVPLGKALYGGKGGREILRVNTTFGGGQAAKELKSRGKETTRKGELGVKAGRN